MDPDQRQRHDQIHPGLVNMNDLTPLQLDIIRIALQAHAAAIQEVLQKLTPQKAKE